MVDEGDFESGDNWRRDWYVLGRCRFGHNQHAEVDD